MDRRDVTPDGRYFVVRGRLWRCANPSLPLDQRQLWVNQLMAARREKAKAMRKGDTQGRVHAKRQIETAKVALGERGAPWWTDGAPDWNRHLVKNTPYAEWFSQRWNTEDDPG